MWLSSTDPTDAQLFLAAPDVYEIMASWLNHFGIDLSGTLSKLGKIFVNMELLLSEGPQSFLIQRHFLNLTRNTVIAKTDG